MIVYSPINLPNLEVNWDKFWDVWNTYSKPLVKVRNMGHSGVPVGPVDAWIGIDLYRRQFYMPGYYAPLVDLSTLPELAQSVENIKKALPTIECIRIIQSTEDIFSHTDDNLDEWKIRKMFHYTSETSQWYFTKPEDRLGNRHYISLPDTTSWFAYNDKHAWHGSDYDNEHPKLLVQLFFQEKLSTDLIADLLEESFKEHKDYVIEF